MTSVFGNSSFFPTSTPTFAPNSSHGYSVSEQVFVGVAALLMVLGSCGLYMFTAGLCEKKPIVLDSEPLLPEEGVEVKGPGI